MFEIKVFEGISAVTFNNLPSDNDGLLVCDIFSKIGAANIDLDMISQEISANGKINIGFTFADSDLTSLLSIVKTDNVPTPMVSCGNVKFVVKSPEMVGKPGVASRVISAVRSAGCVPLVITTGLDEISILVRDSDSTDVGKKLSEL